MSVRTVNVGVVNPLRLLDASSVIEGPPFYASLRLNLSISGSRSHTDGSGITRAESLSFSKEVTLSRVPLILTASAPTPPAASDGLTSFTFDYGVFSSSPPGAGDFSVGTENWDASGNSQQIGRQKLLLIYDQTFAAEVCGTWSVTGNPDPADDTSGNIEISAFPIPGFILSTISGSPEDYRTPMDKWRAVVEAPSVIGAGSGTTTDVDVSGWTNAQWRSKLGTYFVDYTETDWYTSGATTDVTATFEWELS